MKPRKCNWIGHVLRRNCFLKHVIEEKVEQKLERKRKQGIRRQQLLGDLMGKKRHLNLGEERALDRSTCRRGLEAYKPVLRQDWSYTVKLPEQSYRKTIEID